MEILLFLLVIVVSMVMKAKQQEKLKRQQEERRRQQQQQHESGHDHVDLSSRRRQPVAKQAEADENPLGSMLKRLFGEEGEEHNHPSAEREREQEEMLRQFREQEAAEAEARMEAARLEADRRAVREAAAREAARRREKAQPKPLISSLASRETTGMTAFTGAATYKPPAPGAERPKPAGDNFAAKVRERLRANPEAAREAFIMGEIFGKPVGAQEMIGEREY